MNEAISSEMLATNEPAEPVVVSIEPVVVTLEPVVVTSSSDTFKTTASKALNLKLLVMTIALQKRENCQFDLLDIPKFTYPTS